jgi:hypothetical protein
MKATNTNRKESPRAASSEGTQAHVDKALIANNVKYFMFVQGMSREEAQKRVDSMPFEDLLSSPECNAQIKRAKQEENRKAEAAAREKEQREAAEKANREREERVNEYEKQEAEKAAQAKRPKEIDSESRAFVENMLEKGNTVSQIRGYLQFKGYKKADITAYIETLDIKKASPRGKGFDFIYEQYCAESRRSLEELEAFIDANATDNIKRFRAMFMRRGEFFNEVHDRYTKQ